MQSRREAAVWVREGLILNKWGGVRESPPENFQKWMQMVRSETVLADCVCLFFS